MRIDWVAKASHLLQTLAFCLAASAIQVAFQPSRRYDTALVYSLAIGTSIWLLIDFGSDVFGSDVFASDGATGWPGGHARWLLPLASVAGGYLLGTLIGDAWFGWSSWSGDGLQTLPTSLLITALTGAAAIYYFYSRTQRRLLGAQMTQVRAQAAQARLRLLESQLEPHMLFNTLANLRVLIETDPARALRMLDHLIAYLRATLAASRATTHTLQAEFERLRDYLELMAIRMGPRLSFTLELPSELAGLRVPALLLQPLVENAIGHGLEPKREGGHVGVQASRHGDTLRLRVQDTGVGMDSEAAAVGSGFGLTQVRERLATAYGAAARLVVLPEAHSGVGIQIELPCAALPYEDPSVCDHAAHRL